MKRFKEITLVDWLNDQLLRSSRKAEKANMNLSVSLARMNEEMRQRNYEVREHGTQANTLRISYVAAEVERASVLAQKSRDEENVLKMIVAMCATILKDRPDLKNYQGVGRWIREDEREWLPESEKLANRAGFKEEALNLNSYPAHMRGLFDYILNNRR